MEKDPHSRIMEAVESGETDELLEDEAFCELNEDLLADEGLLALSEDDYDEDEDGAYTRHPDI